MKFTYYGHSCFAIESNGKTLLFDPFITGNPLATKINVDNIKADFILVSHGHGDHVGDLISIAKRTGAQVIGAYEVMEWTKTQGLDKVHGMNFGPFNFEFGKMHYLPAWHSSVLPDGTYGANPGGFLLHNTEKKFYYAGDTSLMMDMQLIPRYCAIDIAILPIGGNFTMDVDDALIAAEFIKCNKIVGVHFDTFGWIEIDHEKAKEKFKAAGKELILPEIGQTIEL